MSVEKCVQAIVMPRFRGFNLRSMRRRARATHVALCNEMLRLDNNMQRSNRFLPSYLLITSGPRHVADMTKQPSARAQMSALERVAEEHDAELNIVAWDYARKIKSLDDVCKLFATLAEMKRSSEDGQVSGRLLIDSYCRLLKAATPEMQPALWSALIEYEGHIRDIQTRKSLIELSPEMALLVRTGRMPRLKVPREAAERTEVERQAQTESAREYSKLFREQRAKRAARELKEAFDAYKGDTPGASLKSFVESDASNGVLNSHGSLWAYSSAKRVLRKMKKEHI